MKYFLLIGGFSGFTLTFASGLLAGNDLTIVLRDASIGCLGGGLLLRGFRAVMTHQLRQVLDRQSQRETASPAAAVAAQA